MTEDTKTLNLTGLRGEICDPLRSFGNALIHSLADNLESVTVVGSSLTGDFRAGRSDINTVLVLKSYKFTSVEAIAAMAKTMRKKNLSAPLLMTTEYIDRSRDVFGIELLDLQLIHCTILGGDPFETLEFKKSDVRLQCERELKAILIRMRQGYVAAAGNSKLVRDILISACRSLVPLLRAMLWLKDKDRPRTAEALLAKAASEFSVNLDCVTGVRKWAHQRRRPNHDEMAAAFEAVYNAVEKLAHVVDQLEV